MPQQPPVGQVLIIEVSRSHSGTPQSVGLLWKRDRHDAETAVNTQYSRKTMVGFEPTITESERPQTRSDTGVVSWSS